MRVMASFPIPGRVLARIACSVALLAIALPALAAPSADMWPRWLIHDAASTAQIDHGRWSELIGKYRKVAPDGIARFAYGAVTASDRAALNAYVAGLAATPISRFNRREQFAFWVNLYNALTVKTVLDHYPVKSILDIDISPGWFSLGPWGARQVTVEREKISLDDIEHRILRPIWKDPRTHYVVNCASLGCPDLPPVAMTADNAEQLLNDGAACYVNHPRGVSDLGGRIVVSSIYSWFQADFGGSEAGVLDHLRRFAAPALKVKLKGRDGYDDHAYDWALNGR